MTGIWDELNQSIRLRDMEKFQHFLNVIRPKHPEVTDQIIFDRIAIEMIYAISIQSDTFNFVKKALVELANNRASGDGSIHFKSVVNMLLAEAIIQHDSFVKDSPHFREVFDSIDVKCTVVNGIVTGINSSPDCFNLFIRTVHQNYKDIDLNARGFHDVTAFMMIARLYSEFSSVDVFHAALDVGMDPHLYSDIGDPLCLIPFNNRITYAVHELLFNAGVDPLRKIDFKDFGRFASNLSVRRYESFFDHLEYSKKNYFENDEYVEEWSEWFDYLTNTSLAFGNAKQAMIEAGSAGALSQTRKPRIL